MAGLGSAPAPASKKAKKEKAVDAEQEHGKGAGGLVAAASDKVIYPVDWNFSEISPVTMD